MKFWKVGVLVSIVVLVFFTLSCGRNSAPPATPAVLSVSSAPQACKDAVVHAGSPTQVNIMWSIYTGWMPWPYAAEAGILKEWGKKCNVIINLLQADYIASIEAYVARQVDGVTMTNMEALNMAAFAGIDTTAVIIGDYSDDNDAVLTRQGKSICDLSGTQVTLVQFSVSHYLLARGLQEECGNTVEASDIKLVNISDADIATAASTGKALTALVTWNPMALQILDQNLGFKKVYGSSQIPGEILDILFVRTELVQQHPEVGMALAGAWYDILDSMRGSNREAVLASMAEKAGDTRETFERQLQTTHMFWTPETAAAFARDPKLKQTMEYVRDFCFEVGLLGSASPDTVGISFPNGEILGNSQNVKLRFTDTYMSAIRR